MAIPPLKGREPITCQHKHKPQMVQNQNTLLSNRATYIIIMVKECTEHTQWILWVFFTRLRQKASILYKIGLWPYQAFAWAQWCLGPRSSSNKLVLPLVLLPWSAWRDSDTRHLPLVWDKTDWSTCCLSLKQCSWSFLTHPARSIVMDNHKVFSLTWAPANKAHDWCFHSFYQFLCDWKYLGSKYKECKSDFSYPDIFLFFSFSKSSSCLTDTKEWTKICGRPYKQLSPYRITGPNILEAKATSTSKHISCELKSLVLNWFQVMFTSWRITGD